MQWLEGIGVHDTDRILLERDWLVVGQFRCPLEHPRFGDSGQPTRHHVIVFPRTCVTIDCPDQEPIVADANTVMFYNRSQEFRRRPISAQGDRADWFGLDEQVLVDACLPHDPAAQDRPGRPFAFVHGPGHPDLYFLQRRVVESLTAGASALSPEPLFLEEAVLEVVRGTVARAYRRQGRARAPGAVSPATRRQRRERVEQARSWVAQRLGRRLTLDDVADATDTSPFHLSRIFREETGETLHRYINRLRLHHSLERVVGPQRDLTDVAMDLGFSSHSHFSAAFRRGFGMPPSQARRLLRRPLGGTA